MNHVQHADKLLADAIQDDPETGSFNMDEAVDVFVQKAKEWQQYVQGAQQQPASYPTADSYILCVHSCIASATYIRARSDS
jgi:hypothetical protein